MPGSRVRANVKPALIKWARTSAHFSIEDAAERAKVAQETLAAWEDGTDAPSIPQLRNLAAVYKRPIVVFYLPEPPKEFDALRDYRRLPGGSDGRESPDLAAEIRWAREMREVLLEACALTETEIPTLGLEARIDQSPDRVARQARNVLNVAISEGRNWTSPYDSFNRWRRAVESRGVLCLQFSGVDVDEARAFAVADFPLPIIAVNTKDAPSARLFSLMHEFGHLMLGRTGKCDLHESLLKSANERDLIETFCNAVAGRILVPADALEETLAERDLDEETGQWDDETLRVLARPYGVSRDAFLRRLVDTGHATLAFYREKRRAWAKAQEAAPAAKPSGGGDYYRNLRSKLGAPLIHTVVAAYHAGAFTANEAAAFLNVKVGNLERLASGVE